MDKIGDSQIFTRSQQHYEKGFASFLANPLKLQFIAGGPGRTRTFGQLIKSQLLYQLSYRPKKPRECRNIGIMGQGEQGA